MKSIFLCFLILTIWSVVLESLGVLRRQRFDKKKCISIIKILFLGILPFASFLIENSGWEVWIFLEISILGTLLFVGAEKTRYQAEAISKYLNSLIIGIVLVTSIFVFSGQSQDLLFWPLTSIVKYDERWILAILSAFFFSGVTLALGWPPLQQGWVDLNEAFQFSIGDRSALTMVLGFAFAFVYSSYYLKFLLPSPIILSMTLLWVVCCSLNRMISLVQMSVSRTFAYQDSFIFLPLIVFFAAHVNGAGSGNSIEDLCLVDFFLVTILYFKLRIGPLDFVQQEGVQWNSRAALTYVRRFECVVYLDLLQSLTLIVGCVYSGLFMLAIALVFYSAISLCLLLRFGKLRHVGDAGELH